MFGVLATGFSVLLGFIVFLAFESYDQSRSGAEEEALVVAQQVETAQRLGEPVAAPLAGQLICYGRSMVNIEWPRATEGTLGDQIPSYAIPVYGPCAAGGRAIEARTDWSGVAGTSMSPRVGRSRSKVTSRSIVTRPAAATTGRSPRPSTAR